MSAVPVIFAVITALIALFAVVRCFDGNPERPDPELDSHGLERPLTRFHRPARLTKRDGLLIALITLLYVPLAFLGLGETKTPVSAHSFARGESATLTLAGSGTVARIQYDTGPTVGSWRLDRSADGERWTEAGTLSQNYGEILRWMEAEEWEPAALRYLRITALEEGGILSEVALRDEGGALLSFTADVPELGDEQALVPEEQTYLNSSYFDEIYHPRTAWEMTAGHSIYEITHPPLGKAILSLGIRLFGLTPFGWRFMGALFGVLMLPLLYVFLKLMLGSSMISASVTAIFALDFMHYVQTRIATIDTYGVFFTLFMYFFFYLWYTQPWDAPLKKTLPALALSGLGFALGAASKWTCIFAGGGLFVLWCVKVLERLRRGGRRELRAWVLPTAGWSCVFFLLFPVLAYLLSYLSYAAPAGVEVFSPDYPKLILDNIRYMYNYHAGLEATHPYQSVWWQWVLDLRPILYYLHYFTEDYSVKSAFGAFGNPLFWWTGLGAMLCMAVKAIRGDKMALFILVGYLACLLPWVTVERCAFAYHYFPCTLFLALALGRMLRDCDRRGLGRRDFTAPFLAGGCALLFAVFFPALSGVTYVSAYGNALLRWFGGMWPF